MAFEKINADDTLNQGRIKINNILDAVESQVSELKSKNDNHILFNEVLQDQTLTTLDIESSDIYKHDLYVKVTNNGKNVGYFTIIVQKNNKNILTSTDGQGGTAVLLDVGESYTLPIWGLTNKFGAIGNYKILVQNINNEKCSVKVFYNKITEINSLLYKIPSTMVTVGSKGDGDFSNIQSAIDYLKNNFDVNNTPTIVLIKPGTYQVFPRKTPTKHNAYPAIDKGANRISIIGIERDITRIFVINSEEMCGEIMSVGGDCIIKNIKFESYAGTASSETIKSHRAYGLHIDYPSERDTDHATIIENCIVYSSSFTPIGAGMNRKQKQIYRNSDFIYDSELVNEQGAVYIHSTKNSDKPMGLIIENCNIVSKNGAYTIHLPNVGGAEYTWQKIPVTLRRNITVTTGETELITDKNYLSLLSMDSKLNSNENINY